MALLEIPIEERDSGEVTEIAGLTSDGAVQHVMLTPVGTAAANYAFDVTPARLVTGLITERGVCQASKDGLTGLYPEYARKAWRRIKSSQLLTSNSDGLIEVYTGWLSSRQRRGDSAGRTAKPPPRHQGN